MGGRLGIVGAGAKLLSTSRAAYSVPMCVALFQVESGCISVFGKVVKGWTHQMPPRA